MAKSVWTHTCPRPNFYCLEAAHLVSVRENINASAHSDILGSSMKYTQFSFQHDKSQLHN